MSFFMQLDTDMFIDLVIKAIEKDAEDRLWEQWLAELPNMTEKTFIPFQKYRDKRFKRNTADVNTDKTDEEILQDADNILKMKPA